MRTIARIAGIAGMLLAACAGPEIERGVPDDGRPHDLWFAITAVSVPVPQDGAAVGADLDDRIGDPARGTIASCADLARDHVSWRDGRERGVDDAAPALLPIARDVLGEPIDAALERAIAEGDLDLALAIRGVRARGDGAVEVAIVSRADGREVGVAPGTIEGTTVRARFDAISIPIARPIPLLPLGELGESAIVLDLALDSQGERVLRDAGMGTSLSVASIVRDARAIDAGWAPVARRMIEASADLDPSEDDPMICERLSIGLALEGHEI